MTPPPFWNFSENSSVLVSEGFPYLASDALFSSPVSVPVIYHNLPEAIRNHATVQQVQGYYQDAVGWVKNLTNEEKGNHLGTIHAQEAPSKNDYEAVEMELNKAMVNITDMSLCENKENINIKVYNAVINNIGKELKLPEDEIEAIRLAQYMDKTVKTLEKLEQRWKHRPSCCSLRV